ncbi:Fibrillarin [Giardia duodenalis assemblage B]|uniref:Fibrillarin n=1 Tax=Giardia duodenalis assemblage B TaxID=1394984 RepID=A0A132NMA7_GIAIN|nr:Fibrillarin [Giardia intestinalis assemblage B]
MFPILVSRCNLDPSNTNISETRSVSLRTKAYL